VFVWCKRVAHYSDVNGVWVVRVNDDAVNALFAIYSVSTFFYV
jgi:hypothetical protein